MLKANPVTSWNQEASLPTIHPSSFVDESAVLIGRVVVEEMAIVCPAAVLRADEGFPIRIGAGTNVQDGVLMHCLRNSEIQIGSGCSIAHGAVIHGPCAVGDSCFVGFRATLKGVRLGAGCFIDHHALVLDVEVPAGRYVAPGQVVRKQEEADRLPPATRVHRDFNLAVLAVNDELRIGYLNQQMVFSCPSGEVGA